MNKISFAGRVYRHTGSHYLVKSEMVAGVIDCVVRGRMRMLNASTTNPVAIGDRVDFKFVNDGKGLITAVHPRRNYLIRRATNLSHEAHVIAANLDAAYLIVTMSHPQTAWEFVDRFLVSCEAYGVPVKLVINKTDLYDDEANVARARFRDVYRRAGYGVLETSAVTGSGIERLRDDVCGRFCLFAGVSGVGKSSLLNALDPALQLRTGALSAAHRKGTHTTTFYEVFEPASGGAIIDSPGIKGFGLVEVDHKELYHFFPEIFRMSARCHFNPCTHTHEPECAVRDAVRDGFVSVERYTSYLKMLLEGTSKYRE
jgi:ribosome biogenesis GTPase